MEDGIIRGFLAFILTGWLSFTFHVGDAGSGGPFLCFFCFFFVFWGPARSVILDDLI